MSVADDRAPRGWMNLSGAEWAWAAALPVAFVAILYWFDVVDFHGRHFFDRGGIVFANNLVRIAFVSMLCWLVYAPGAAVLALLLRGGDREALTGVERGVLGFGIGIGLWHVFMLILGHAQLYYRPVVAGLCFLIVLASCGHFGRAAAALCRRLGSPRQGSGAALDRVAIMLVVAAAVWLMVARGLYPGGGGDFYTHYSYYNLAVLKNHGLAPNDVWYHFYYSQGYGLHFLGMLLTDPEAPALATYACVVVAAVAMAAVAWRIAPGTLWPACVAVPYLLIYIVLTRRGGEFQKGHEQMAALIVLAMIGLSLSRGAAGRAWLVMASSCGVAVATIAQPFGVIVGFFFLLLAAWSLVQGRRSDMWRYGCAGVAIGGTVAAIFAYSFLATGLPNDQAMDLMLRFGDIGRLDRWGVLPQVIVATWIRDNYAINEPEVGLPAYWDMLRSFTRIDLLWVFVALPVVLLVPAAVAALRGRRGAAGFTAPARGAAPGAAAVAVGVLRVVGAFVLFAALVSMIAGKSQSTSYERASSFFFPLVLLLAMAACTWAASLSRADWVRRSSAWQQPVLLVVGTLVLWSTTFDWQERVVRASANGFNLLFGRYSLAEAYSRIQDAGHPFGGINPHALEAAQQLAPGTRIWSTTVDAYCMVPGCWIESVVSFKTASRLDEILTAPPETAKQLLQEAGLDYFLFIKDAFFLDLLPYSRLFAPDTIGDYLGIKWTNGTAFLLTWRGSDTTPLTPEFLDFYRKRIRSEHQWFAFSQLIPHLADAMTSLRDKGWGAAPSFPWRVPPPDGTIHVVRANYGANCRFHVPKPPFGNNFSWGNATRPMRKVCDGEKACTFKVNFDEIPDPVNGCDKDLNVYYRCRADEAPRHVLVAPQVDLKVDLDCR